MNFSEALVYLKRGERIFRFSWKSDPDMWLKLQTNNFHSYISIHKDQFGMVLWSISQADILADDWAIEVAL